MPVEIFGGGQGDYNEALKLTLSMLEENLAIKKASFQTIITRDIPALEKAYEFYAKRDHGGEQAGKAFNHLQEKRRLLQKYDEEITKLENSIRDTTIELSSASKLGQSYGQASSSFSEGSGASGSSTQHAEDHLQSKKYKNDVGIFTEAEKEAEAERFDKEQEQEKQLQSDVQKWFNRGLPGGGGGEEEEIVEGGDDGDNWYENLPELTEEEQKMYDAMMKKILRKPPIPTVPPLYPSGAPASIEPAYDPGALGPPGGQVDEGVPQKAEVVNPSTKATKYGVPITQKTAEGPDMNRLDPITPATGARQRSETANSLVSVPNLKSMVDQQLARGGPSSVYGTARERANMGKGEPSEYEFQGPYNYPVYPGGQPDTTLTLMGAWRKQSHDSSLWYSKKTKRGLDSKRNKYYKYSSKNGGSWKKLTKDQMMSKFQKVSSSEATNFTGTPAAGTKFETMIASQRKRKNRNAELGRIGAEKQQNRKMGFIESQSHKKPRVSNVTTVDRSAHQ